jgi:hypothetical protein
MIDTGNNEPQDDRIVNSMGTEYAQPFPTAKGDKYFVIFSGAGMVGSVPTAYLARRVMERTNN